MVADNVEMVETFENQWALQALSKDSSGVYMNETVRTSWAIFKVAWNHQDKKISELKDQLSHYKMRLDASTNTDSRLKEADEVIESVAKEGVVVMNKPLVTYLIKYGEFNLRGAE